MTTSGPKMKDMQFAIPFLHHLWPEVQSLLEEFEFQFWVESCKSYSTHAAWRYGSLFESMKDSSRREATIRDVETVSIYRRSGPLWDVCECALWSVYSGEEMVLSDFDKVYRSSLVCTYMLILGCYVYVLREDHIVKEFPGLLLFAQFN